MTGTLMAGGGFRRALADAGDRTLLTGLDGASRTGHQLAERVSSLAGVLGRRGMTGQRVGLWYRNSLAAFEAFLATEWVGATRVVVDPEVPAAEARAVFDAAAVELVVADEEHAPGLGGDTITHGNRTRHDGPPWDQEVTVDPAFPLLVYPRSVSAGKLFGVTTSYGNWDAVLRTNVELYRQGWYGQGFDDGECALTMQQLMHGTGMVTSFPFLLIGLPQVVMGKFSAASALEAIGRHHITATFAVPGMLTRIADELERHPSTLPLRHTLYGGAPLPLGELRRVRRVIGASLVQLYGRFEAGWPLTILGQEEHQKILDGDNDLATSCGRFIPQIQARLVPAAGAPAGRGELQTKNAMVSAEYADPQGWCALGDVAYLDSGGYVHLTGRLDGMINTGSYHVYPKQVSEAIESVPGVVAAKVTGEPDPVWGQAVTAHIIPAEPDHWDQLVTTLKAELPNRLAKYKIPKTFRKVDHIP